MEISYQNFTTRDLRGSSLAELLVNIEADLTVADGDRLIYSEFQFPVAELAMELAAWMRQPDVEREEFSFDSISFDESGSVRICKSADGWMIGSVFEADAWTIPVDWETLEKILRRFIRNVNADVVRAGIDPRNFAF